MLKEIQFSELPKLLEVIGSILEVEPSSLTIESNHDSVEGWDSMKVVQIAVAIETEFKITFDPVDVVEMISVRRIIEILQSHGSV